MDGGVFNTMYRKLAETKVPKTSYMEQHCRVLANQGEIESEAHYMHFRHRPIY